MDNPFAAVEILFFNKSPDRLKLKERSGKSIFQPAFQVFANHPIPSETPFSGQRNKPIPYLLW
jgi:hypothetical protein